MSTDCLNGLVVHHHRNVQVTVTSTIKQLPQLVRQACNVVQTVLNRISFGRFWAQNGHSQKKELASDFIYLFIYLFMDGVYTLTYTLPYLFCI